MAPDVGGDYYWEQFFVGNGLLLLRRRPRPCEPEALENSPKPKDPAASEETSTSAAGSKPGKSQKLTPCHCDKNWCHQSKSRWNSLLRQIRWSFLRKQHKRSIMRRRKVLPGQTTLAARCRWPMRDSSSHPLQCLRGSHKLIRPCKASSISAGRRATWLTESNSIPRTTSTVARPSHFPRWRGRFKPFADCELGI